MTLIRIEFPVKVYSRNASVGAGIGKLYEGISETERLRIARSES